MIEAIAEALERHIDATELRLHRDELDGIDLAGARLQLAAAAAKLARLRDLLGRAA